MLGDKRLTVLVSANGYGHIRRQILVAKGLMRRFKKLRVIFAVTEKQYQRFKLEIESLGSMADVVPGVMEESVRWRHDPKTYEDENLNGWETEWRSHPKLQGSDFVVSDNLTGVLEHRSDAVLSGSFLWSEVIGTYASFNDSCKKFVDRETYLLKTYKPKMICNRYLASSAVMNLTDAVPVSWIIDSDDIASKKLADPNPKAVLVHGGGTRTLDNKVIEIASILRQARIKVFTDIEDDKNCFDYQDETWKSIGAVICRPGAGTATECVKWKIPMLILRDTNNSEAEFIARRLSELGLAHGFPGTLEGIQFVEKVKEILSPEKQLSYLSPFDSCIRNGILETVDFLEKYWDLS